MFRYIPVFLIATTGAMAWFVGAQTTLPYFIYTSWMATLLMGLAWWKGELWNTKTVLIFGIIFRIVLVPVLPSLSDDGFRFIWDGWLQWQGINPFMYQPNHSELAIFHSLDLYKNLNSATYFTVYPPVSQIIFALGGLFYPFGWMVAYVVIKLLFVGIECLGVFLLSRMVQPKALLLYAWNPLVLVEVAGQPHNEALLVTWLIGTIWALQNDRPKTALVLITLAMWTKLYPALLIPFVLNRTGWRYVWVPISVGFLLLLPYYHPDFFTNIRASINLYTQQFEFGAGLYYMLKEWGRLLMGHEESKALGPFLQMIFLSTVLWFWVQDVARRKSLSALTYLTIGMFLLTATTVHPWYFLGLFAMIPFLSDIKFEDKHASPIPMLYKGASPPWHWIWLGSMMTGNYFFYLTQNQWPWVFWGWVGWLVLLCLLSIYGWMKQIHVVRAENKYEKIKHLFPNTTQPLKVLDLGSGEGFLGAWIQQKIQAEVTLTDVLNLNRTQLPFFQYDGQNLPFEDKCFEVTVLSFVLHHCEDQAQVFNEVVRVTQKQIIILESVYHTAYDLKQLTFLDKLANRIRSGGLMTQQEEFLNFRTVQGWYSFFKDYPVRIKEVKQNGLFLHQQAVFSLEVRN